MNSEQTRYMVLRSEIEVLFSGLGRIAYRHRIKTLLIVFAIAGSVCSQLPTMQLDTSALGLISKHDPIRLDYNEFIDQFGSDEIVIIAIKSPEIFDERFFQKLKSFHDDLEAQVPYVKEVNSLINARRTRGHEDVLIVDELFSKWPDGPSDLSAIKDEVMSNPVFINNLISEDGQYAAVVVETEVPAADSETENEVADSIDWGMASSEDEDGGSFPEQRFLSDKQIGEIASAIYAVTERYQGPDFSIHITGNPIVNDVSNRISITDAAIIFAIDVLLIAVFPLLLFRRLSGVVFPNMIMMSTIMTTMGLIAICKVPFTAVTIIVPSFLIVVCVGDSIHILSIFYRNLNQGYGKEDAICAALGHSGAAVLMTSVTSAAGIMSFAFADLAPFVDIGIFGPVGVFLALFYTVIMLPALIAVFPIKEKSTGLNQSVLMDRVLLGFANFSIRNPKKIVISSLVIGLVSVVFVFQVEISHFPLSWFPDDMTIRKDTELVDAKLKGATPLEVVIDTKKENGMYDPEVLNAIETFSQEAAKIRNDDIYVGKLFSINDILKETNRALHGNDPAHYRIPQDRNLISQELLLFEASGSDDLERVVDASFSKGRITIKAKSADGIAYTKFIADMEKRLEVLFAGKADVTMTGTMTLVSRAFSAALNTMTKSYIACFSIVCLLMIILVGDWRIGLMSMVPNLLPITLIMGIIGLVGSPLDMTTMMVCTIALGVIVDDTVHFIYNFRKFYDKTGDAVTAIQETFLGTGRALLVTSLILSLAYFACEFGVMKNVARYGFYTGLVIVAALISDFVVTPALMLLVTRSKNGTVQNP